MAFPTGWPPRVGSGLRSIRFFLRGTTGGSFDSNAYLFADQASANTYVPLPTIRPGEDVSAPDYNGPHSVGANPAGTGQRGDDPHPMIWAQKILVVNDGSTELEVSFDGANVHGVVDAGGERIYNDRHEAGIAVRGGGAIATGSITTIPVINLLDGETFTLDDGVHPPVVFEFDVSGNGVTPGNILVDVSTDTTADDVRDTIIAAINGIGADFLMTASNGGAATVSLAQDFGGSHGNTTQTDTVINVGFVVTDMTGGTDSNFRVEAW